MYYRIRGKVHCTETLAEMLIHWLGKSPRMDEPTVIADIEVERVFHDLDTDAPIIYQDYYCKMGDVTIYDLTKATKLDLVLKAREKAATLHFTHCIASDEWIIGGETPYGRKDNAWFPLVFQTFLSQVHFQKVDGEYPLPEKTWKELNEEYHNLENWHLRFVGHRPTVQMPEGWSLPRELSGCAMESDEIYPMLAVQQFGITIPDLHKKP